MSLDKAIKHGKEKRKPYTRSRAFDKSCRNHGGCTWCENNRKHKHKRRTPIVESEEELMGLFSKKPKCKNCGGTNISVQEFTRAYNEADKEYVLSTGTGCWDCQHIEWVEDLDTFKSKLGNGDVLLGHG